MISICIGAVRVATAQGWDDAREILRKDIEEVYPRFSLIEGPSARAKAAELRRLEAEPDGGWLVTSGPAASFNTMRWAREGEHGLTAGKLAIIRDYSNGNRYAWTVNVKCKIKAVDHKARKATVQITGNSVQFERHDLVTLPFTFLAYREK